MLIREAIGKAETILLAKEEACKSLGVATHDAEFEILQMPSKKTLGIFGGKMAEVRAFISKDPKKISEEFIRSIFDAMNVGEYEIKPEKKEGGIEYRITGDGVNKIIGKRGETLDAIQYLTGLIANNSNIEGDEYFKVSVNIGDYRERRKKTLESLGVSMAKKALKFKRNFYLEPMNPFERRVIHSAVQQISGVMSWSEGEGQDRHVVIGNEKYISKSRGYKRNFNRSRNFVNVDKQIGNSNAPLYGKIK